LGSWKPLTANLFVAVENPYLWTRNNMYIYICISYYIVYIYMYIYNIYIYAHTLLQTNIDVEKSAFVCSSFS
jgi:hypothetical protein